MKPEQAAKERGKILGMVIMGCDLEIAAHIVGWTTQQLEQERENNPEFAADLALREGSVELHHMKNVHKAGEDVKNWRASAWWIARKSAERREQRLGRSISLDDLHLWVEGIIEAIWTEVKSAEDRDRVMFHIFKLLDARDQEAAVEIAGRKEFDEAYGKTSTASG
jgi:hypothetical protein